ncbi:uncharacterized protein COLE_02990 [Cutaneotrichosporon oleaginosum]|uniref:uncharacterized protein n=1 Tax=Cutaneotrichosporon oleaginosum TaxID=879819 RepID=UPI001328B300|nr:hypothetical protein COLE_02990 [Cutaneotrichosporon oleaginosum]
MAYRPPHMRNRAPPASAPATHLPPLGTADRPPPGARGSGSPGRGLSRGDVSRATGRPPRGAPPGMRADGLRRARDTPPPDEMELLASVSRSGGNADGDRLKDPETQARFRAYIEDKRYRAARGANADADTEALSTIVRLLRKLREGVVAAGRCDAFAVQGAFAGVPVDPVFEDSVRYAVLTRAVPQLNAVLHGLVPDMYRAADAAGTILEPDNRAHFASLLLVYHLVHSQRKEYQRMFEVLTLPPAPLRVAPGLDDIPSLANLSLRTPSPPSLSPTPTHRTIPAPTPAFIAPSSLRFAEAAARALAHETFDPLSFAALTRPGSGGDAGDLALTVLSWAAPTVRERVRALMRQSYMSVPLPWAARLLGLTDSGAEAWAREEGLTVAHGIVKLR